MPIEMLPPHDTDAEAAVLGSVLIDPDAMLDVADILTADAFYRPAHRWTYEAITALHARQEPLDLLTVRAELAKAGRLEEAGDLPALAELLNAVPTSVSAEYYARVVAEKATRRRLIQAAQAIAKAAYSDTTPIHDVRAAAEAAVLAAGSGDERGVLAPRRHTSDYLDNFLQDVATPFSPRVVNTGLIDLDRALGGLEAPHQYIIAGRTSMGKAALALGIALHAALHGKRVMVFSPEMSAEQIDNRMVSMMTRIPAQKLRRGSRYHLTPQEQSAVVEATGRLSDVAPYLDCSGGLRPADVRTRATRIAAAQGLDLIVVDHMHIMKANAPTGRIVQDLSAIALDLADCYKELDVAGITLAQLNRKTDERAIKMPMLSDLRDSGGIEENAYAVLFVHREGYYDQTAPANAAQISIAKNRDGATGVVDVYWNPQLSCFVNAAQVQL